MVRVQLTDPAHLDAMNGAHERFIHDALGHEVPPARTTVICDLALRGMLVEIEALGVLDNR